MSCKPLAFLLALSLTLSLSRSPNGTLANVTTAFTVNTYAYSRINLLLAYGFAFLATLLSLFVGFRAYAINGVSHSTSFSAILTTTRNPRLDELTKGQSLGAMPLDAFVGNLRLKFGLLSPENGVAMRAGFGPANEVKPLRKGQKCY